MVGAAKTIRSKRVGKMAKTAKMLKKQQAKDSKDLTKNETSVARGESERKENKRICGIRQK